MRDTRANTGCKSTCGINVSEINRYATDVYMGVDLSTLSYTPLSEPFEALQIRLQDAVNMRNGRPSETRHDAAVNSWEDLLCPVDVASIVKITQAGDIDGVTFWFELHTADDDRNPIATWASAEGADTCDRQQTFWRQAAIVLANGTKSMQGLQRRSQRGESVEVRASVRNSSICFGVAPRQSCEAAD